jgi:hypothetical protein
MAKKKRDLTKTPGLEKRFFSKVKQEYHDIDYAHKLDDKTKEWLSQFMDEDLGAHFSKKKESIVKDRKSAYGRNNRRQRDIYGVSRAIGRLLDVNNADVQDFLEDRSDNFDHEEILIKIVDKLNNPHLFKKRGNGRK